MSVQYRYHKQLLTSFMCLLPGKGCGRPNPEQIAGIRHLGELYNADISCSVDVVVAEPEVWYSHMTSLDKPSVNALEAFCVCDAVRLHAIKRCSDITLTLTYLLSVRFVYVHWKQLVLFIL